jgi:hypothetical protein
MADYPCDNHHDRYPGPSNRAYLNVYCEDQEIKFKTSICGVCLADLVSAWLAIALHQAPAGNYDPPEEGQTLEDLWKPTGGASGAFRGLRRS